MQLRKVCNHPYLFEWPCNGAGEPIEGDNIVNDSGKMQILDKLLRNLHQENHKVLIFCQMTRMLDIIESYFSHVGFRYLRMDGTTIESERQEMVREGGAIIFLLNGR